MKHLYSYKFRLNPSKSQEILFAKHFGCNRFLYNHFLYKNITIYKTDKKSTKLYDNIKEIPNLKQLYPWLKEVGSQSLQYSVECLQTAYENFFRKCKQKTKKKGFPRFKKKHDKQSFKIKQNIHLIDNKLIIPKFLEGIYITQHRILEGNIRFATISKNKAGQYHVSITVEREIEPLLETTKSIGIDMNVYAMVDSNNKVYPNPLPGRQYAKRLKLLHQQVSRSQKGSKGRTKACKKLAKVYLKTHNKREDHLHKLSKNIINENQVICIEDLCVESMLAKVLPKNREEPRWKEKNRHKDIADSGFYSFAKKLCYKAILYGRIVVKVSRWFPSSQLCHHCNWQNKDLPKDCKIWCCLNCWENNERNYNSACNILYEGLRILTSGMEGIAACSYVRPVVKDGLLVRAEAATL